MICTNKTIKRALKIISLIAVLAVLNNLAYWAVSLPSYSHWSNHDIKMYKDEIDTAFFGTSHIYASINPALFDEKTGSVCMNCGSGGQGIKETYFYLNQMNLSCGKLKNVFVDLYFEDFLARENNRGSDLQSKMLICSRLTNLKAKSYFIINSFELNELQYVFFPALYCNSNIDQIPQIVKQKLSSEYRNYACNADFFDDIYVERGFIPLSPPDENDTDRFYFLEHIQYTRNINEEAFIYLDKIVEYCKKNNLNLFFVQMPLSSVANAENKDFLKYFDDIIDGYIEKNGLSYVNFNTTVSRTELTDIECFSDSEYLNRKGADVITNVIAQYYLNSKSA